MPMSQASLESDTTSLKPSLAATCSTFVVDGVEHSWKQDIQNMVSLITWKMYLEVEFLLLEQPTESELVYQIIDMFFATNINTYT